MRQSGVLARWNDERGFGFITGDDGGNYFVHISDIARAAERPRVGDRLTFRPTPGRDGGQRASEAAIEGAMPRSTPPVTSQRLNPMEWRWALGLLLAMLLLWGIGNGRLRPEIAGAYIFVGLLSFAGYYLDKRSAERGRWRIQEATLLCLDLCFGIIGGLAGQAAFRHKTRKPSYVVTTVLVAVLHVVWLAGIASGLIDPRDVLGLVGL